MIVVIDILQNVLAYAVKHNRQRRKASATVQYLDAWRQTAEVMFAVAPIECLPFEMRFILLLELISELLTKVFIRFLYCLFICGTGDDSQLESWSFLPTYLK